MRWLVGVVLAWACWLALSCAPIMGQGNTCRTSPVGASTYYCASEAFVTNSSGFSGQPVSVTGNLSITAINNQCGALILASGGQNTITLAAPSGFPAKCLVTIKDDEVYSGSGTGRGKLLSGFPADIFPTLYPGQTLMVGINAAGSAWTTIINPGRWKLQTSAELCVVANGDDTHDGLGSGAAADCLKTAQQAVLNIGEHWDGSGYFACQIGYYAGGTSTFSEQVSMTGQSSGCYLTFNWRGAVTNVSTGPCFSGGDNGIAIFNMNLGFVPVIQCNTSNAVGTSAFYCHQTCIYDVTGSFEWVPSGSHDHLFFLDGQGRVTVNFTGGGLVVGDAVNRAFDSMFVCDEHCAQFQVAGAIGVSPNVTGNRILDAFGGSLMNIGSTWSGSAITGITTSKVTGNSVVNTNGTAASIPGGMPASPTATGGQICDATRC